MPGGNRHQAQVGHYPVRLVTLRVGTIAAGSFRREGGRHGRPARAKNCSSVGYCQFDAAFYWCQGGTLKETAIRAGIGTRTLERWIRSDFWAEACQEATTRWLKNLEAWARRTLSLAMDSGDHPELALKLLERMDRRFAPPRVQLELSQHYMHRIEVVSLFRRLAEATAEVVDDPDKRAVIMGKAREILGPDPDWPSDSPGLLPWTPPSTARNRGVWHTMRPWCTAPEKGAS